VGLVRSEYNFLGRAAPPDEREQATFFRALAVALGERPLTIRLFDFGGDKGLPPYLGGAPTPLRGVALALAHPALLLTHLRALLRAAPARPLRLLLPLVTTVEEVRAVQSALAEARAALQGEGIPAAESVELGAMIETLAAVAQIAALAAAGVRFISLGSNDLTRALGVGRHDPALWRVLREATRAARAVALGVELCGELASDPLALPALLELGLDALSVNPLAIPRLRQAGGRG
jgi:phosphoenolpyruvate-protein kinase (PTS system EI component)